MRIRETLSFEALNQIISNRHVYWVVCGVGSAIDHFLYTHYNSLDTNENPGLCIFYLKIEFSGNKLNFDFSLLLKILRLFEKKIIVVIGVFS